MNETFSLSALPFALSVRLILTSCPLLECKKKIKTNFVGIGVLLTQTPISLVYSC